MTIFGSIEEGKKPWWLSSANANELALTVRGILTSVIPLVILASRAYGFSIGEGELKSVIDAVSNVIVAVGLTAASVMTAWGLVRKTFSRIGRVFMV